MSEYRIEFSELDKRIALEALITQRTGMVWTNRHRLACGLFIPYGDEAFDLIAEKMQALIEADNGQ